MHQKSINEVSSLLTLVIHPFFIFTHSRANIQIYKTNDVARASVRVCTVFPFYYYKKERAPRTKGQRNALFGRQGQLNISRVVHDYVPRITKWFHLFIFFSLFPFPIHFFHPVNKMFETILTQ